MRLVGDIGGTNSRLGLVRQGALQPGSLRSYPNDGYGGAEAVIDRFLSDAGAGEIAEIVLAVAGPVTGRNARLTNRDWRIDAGRIAARYGARVRLINDLSALGHAVPVLTGAQLRPVFAGSESGGPGQALVVGIGTGFNVSPVIVAEGAARSLSVEMGHATMPAGVQAALEAHRPGLARHFPTVEDLISGRGLALFSQLAGGQGGLSPARIIDRYGADTGLSGLADAYAGVLGWLLRDLMLAYMPMAGIYFAGSVARGLLSRGASAPCLEVFHRPFPVDMPGQCPIWIIADDAAALQGCSRVAV